MLSRPPHPPPDAAAERRRKHAAVQRASRRRLHRGEVLCTVAVEASTYDLMIYFGELAPAKVDDKDAVNVALGRLLRRAIGPWFVKNEKNCDQVTSPTHGTCDVAQMVNRSHF